MTAVSQIREIDGKLWFVWTLNEGRTINVGYLDDDGEMKIKAVIDVCKYLKDHFLCRCFYE